MLLPSTGACAQDQPGQACLPQVRVPCHPLASVLTWATLGIHTLAAALTVAALGFAAQYTEHAEFVFAAPESYHTHSQHTTPRTCALACAIPRAQAHSHTTRADGPTTWHKCTHSTAPHSMRVATRAVLVRNEPSSPSHGCPAVGAMHASPRVRATAARRSAATRTSFAPRRS